MDYILMTEKEYREMFRNKGDRRYHSPITKHDLEAQVIADSEWWLYCDERSIEEND